MRRVREFGEAMARHGATAEQIAAVAPQHRDRFRVHASPAGVVVQANHGGVWGGTTLDQAVSAMAYQAASKAYRVAQHGAEPEDLLRDQLIAGGMDRERAHDLSRGRAFRDADGRIRRAVPGGRADPSWGLLVAQRSAEAARRRRRNPPAARDQRHRAGSQLGVRPVTGGGRSWRGPARALSERFR
jgi:hypothetical protein